MSSGHPVAPQLQSLQRRQVRAQAGPKWLVGRLHVRRSGRWGDGRDNDSVFAHHPVAELSELFQLKCLSPTVEARPHLNGNNPSIPRI
jgi:hypothetical protein